MSKIKQKMKLLQTKDYLLLIDEEAEIKEGDYLYNSDYQKVVKTDIEYIRSLNSNKTLCSIYNKIITYYPLTKEVKELDLPLLPNPFEDKFEELFNKVDDSKVRYSTEESKLWVAYRNGFKDCFEAQSKGQYSLEDIKKAIEMAREQDCSNFEYYGFCEKSYTDEEIIQSLSTQQLPKEFIPVDYYVCANCLEDKNNPKYKTCHGNYRTIRQFKTIINSEGKKEIQGSYKY